MPNEDKGKTITLTAAADYSAAAARYFPVKITGANEFTACAAGEKSVGFAQLPAKQYEADQIMINGITFAKASAAISAGADIAAAGTYKIRTANGTTDNVIGIALSAATADGDIISVLIR
jgi:hypothetical protein